MNVFFSEERTMAWSMLDEVVEPRGPRSGRITALFLLLQKHFLRGLTAGPTTGF
jgi:hypothetical protein